MFSVLFEVHPRPERWEAYLGYAKALRPELGRIDGFVDKARTTTPRTAGGPLTVEGWSNRSSHSPGSCYCLSRREGTRLGRRRPRPPVTSGPPGDVGLARAWG
jgi:hypothetical protein